jgi:hypothetical protein
MTSSHSFPESNVHLLAAIPNGVWIEDIGLSNDLFVDPVPVINGAGTAGSRASVQAGNPAGLPG